MRNQEAKRILSIGVAILLLFHGIHKILYGIDFIIEVLESYNIPLAEYLAYLIFLGEIIAPLFLLFNKFIKMAGLLIILNMSTIIVLIHIDNLLNITQKGAWSVEVPMFYLIAGFTFFAWEDEQRIC